MSTTSKSPRRVLLVAYETGMEALATYSHPCSPNPFNQPQLFACLVLKTFLRTDYRGLAVLLEDLPDLRRAIHLKRTPHFTTFQKAAHRLLRCPHVGRLLDATVHRTMGRARRVDLAAVDDINWSSRYGGSWPTMSAST